MYDEKTIRIMVDTRDQGQAVTGSGMTELSIVMIMFYNLIEVWIA